MTAPELLTNFQQRGIVLIPAGDRIRYRALTGAITDVDRTVLREHKAEILALLTAPSVPQNGADATVKSVTTAPVRVPGRSVATEHFSREQIPSRPCPGCGGRAWRLRETPGSTGYWLWVCAGCADALAGASPP